jgi:hypothetical protein
MQVPTRSGLVDVDQALRFGEGQRLEKQAVEGAEDGRIDRYDNSFSSIPFTLKRRVA